MKKLLFLLSFTFLLSCSSDDSSEETCCQHPKSEVVENMHTHFQELLASEELSEEQRTMIEADYEAAQEDPCEYFRKELESAGATCDGPH